jgi:hypothetical protein
VSDVLLDKQSAPPTPAAGQAIGYFDSTSSLPAWVTDTGRKGQVATLNASIAAQAGFAADTYLVDSDLLIPSFGVQARTAFRWIVAVSKTAAGAAAPVYTVRIGSARSVADASRLVLTGPLQTAAIDAGVLVIYVVVRNVGAAGVLQGDMNFDHNLAATGFAVNATAAVSATSAGFDNSNLGGLFVGLSINGGASAAWTVTQVRADAMW